MDGTRTPGNGFVVRRAYPEVPFALPPQACAWGISAF